MLTRRWIYLCTLHLWGFIFAGIIITISVYMYCSLQDGDTALIAAASKGHKECIEALLEKGAKVDLENEVSAVSQSIMFPSLKRV